MKIFFLFSFSIVFCSCGKPSYVLPVADQEVVDRIKSGTCYGLDYDKGYGIITDGGQLWRLAFNLELENEAFSVGSAALKQKSKYFYFNKNGSFLLITLDARNVQTERTTTGNERSIDVVTNYDYEFYQGRYNIFENRVTLNVTKQNSAIYYGQREGKPDIGEVVTYYEDAAEGLFTTYATKNPSHWYSFQTIQIEPFELNYYISNGQFWIILENSQYALRHFSKAKSPYNWEDKIIFNF